MNTSPANNLPPRVTGSNNVLRLISYVILAIAAGVLYVAAWLYSNAQEKLETWPRATGTVVALEEDTSRSSHGRHRHSEGVVYHARFRFTAGDGKEYTVLSGTGSNPPSHEVGEQVEVLYPADKPAEAIINSWFELYIWSLALLFVGLSDVTLGGVLFLLSRRK